MVGGIEWCAVATWWLKSTWRSLRRVLLRQWCCWEQRTRIPGHCTAAKAARAPPSARAGWRHGGAHQVEQHHDEDHASDDGVAAVERQDVLRLAGAAATSAAS